MRSWQARARDVAALTNPAYWGIALACVVEGFGDETGEELPFLYAFIALAILGDERSASAVPATSRNALQSWLILQPEIRAKLPQATSEIAPLVREVLLFMVSHEQMAISDRGGISLGSRKPRVAAARSHSEQEIASMCKTATTLGRMFAKAGAVSTVCVLAGIEP